MLSKQCKLHLEEVGMTGLQHMIHAIKIALTLQLLVPIIIIHSIAPRWFKTTATQTMRRLLNEQPNINK
jgi:hypothetical protein